jgi:tRNA modification GTPase
LQPLIQQSLSIVYQPNDTIVALATPAGNGAIAVIRVSGSKSLTIVDDCFSPKGKTKISEAKTHTLVFGDIKDGDEIVDEVLVSIFKNPRSYTGEDSIEISCHGSTYIQGRIIDLLVRKGCRLAQPGEFTMRAYMNKKMDLSQAEAVADLIASSSAAAHQVALNQMRGGFSDDLKTLRQKLIDFASLIELELDFAEEDVEFADRAELTSLINQINVRIIELIGSFKLGNVIKEGVQVAILGEPNAGKSTLLNALLNEERAIVSHIAGTTRDTIEDEVVIEGLKFRFIDTAGLRETSDEIESLGISRALNKADNADIIIYLFDAEQTSAERLKTELAKLKERTLEIEAKLLVVANKVDKLASGDKTQFSNESVISISAKNGDHIDHVRQALIARVNTDSLKKEQTIVTNIRHVEALSNTKQSLDEALVGFENDIPSDLVSIDIKKALFHLGEITGEISSDDLLGNIFGKFCIGK